MSFFKKLFGGLEKTRTSLGGRLSVIFGGKFDDDFYEELEEILITADIGVETTMKAVDMLRDKIKEDKIKDTEEAKKALRDILLNMLNVGNGELVLNSKPSIILVIGVNGVGKTTTIGKLAVKYVSEGKKVMLVAADTFRAAASEQLRIWADRAGADIVCHAEGADPAAVIFDGIAAAKARSCDVIICDTAGRLHNKVNLMNELSKISRIIDRELPQADRETILVLDATTGQNGLVQAMSFKESAGLTGIALTKLDGTAKGGVCIAIADKLNLPIKLVGVGEGKDDLIKFEPTDFVNALF